MARIDFYGQHLYKNKASSIVLMSGQPAAFNFPAGPKKSKSPVPHDQLQQIVAEVASSASMEGLETQAQTRFVYDGESGPIAVSARALNSSTWRVELTRPREGEVAELAPAVAPEPAAPIAPEPGSVGSPKVSRSSVSDSRRELGEVAGLRRSQSSGRRMSRELPRIELAEDEPDLNFFLRAMSKLGASDLHLSSNTPALVRLDGEIQDLAGGRPIEPEELLGMMKDICPPRNWNEFKENWDTDFAHEIPGVARYRANFFMDRQGPGLVMREIPFEIVSAKTLGVPERVLDLCWLSKGLVLVTGPTGSGKSTTLAALIDFINTNRNEHIITIEDPVEFVHQNKKCLINQREVGVHTRSFKAALKAALREDPDIVLVGEMRDLETISIAIETAETGHLVFGTLHTTSAPSTVDRIIDQFPPDRQEQIRTMLSESLRGVVSQVLCKKEGGGRIGAHEVLISNPAVANLIREGKTFQLKSVMQTGRNLGMQTMNDCLMEHVLAGRVKPEEAYIKSNDKATMKTAFAKHNINLSLEGSE